MKILASLTWMPGLILAMACLPVGLAQNQTNGPPAVAPDATLTATPGPAATNPATRAVTAPMDVPSPTAGAATPNAAPGNKPLPAKLLLSPWTTEIVKLAQSGIEDGVMLSFIDNSGTFNLGADQIIYLSDLGISGQIISEMLQHDREVISGVRPVTIVSELATETLFPASWKTSTGMSSKTSAQRVTTPAPSELAAMPSGESLAGVNRGDSDAQPAALQYAMMNEREPVMQSMPDQPRQSSRKKEGLYRVREPYPVELLPPIIFINAAERTPNTFIILGFPRSAP